MDYGKKIAELRKESKLTQAELGTKLNITAQAVSKWENNLSEPDIESIRKMCEIFEVSVDEFLGLSTTKKEEIEKADIVKEEQPVKAILGYCEKCKKPVCAGEFKSANLFYNPNVLIGKVKKSETLHTYCNACHEEILSIQQREIITRKQAKIEAEKELERKEFFKGIIWGSVAFVIACIVFFSAYFSSADPTRLPSTIIICLASFCITAQFIWDGVLFDVFLFFCRSFRVPFGFIFSFSIDGILWLIGVKLVLWAICGILSIIWFIIGLGVTMFMSIIIFPFALVKKIRKIKG